MERADKTLNFGCMIDHKDIWITQIIGSWNRQSEQYVKIAWFTWTNHISLKRLKSIIWNSYWFERILYLHWQKLPPNDSSQSINFQKIIDYIKQKNQKPLLEKCIDRDEEWQQIILDFLLSLPK